MSESNRLRTTLEILAVAAAVVSAFVAWMQWRQSQSVQAELSQVRVDLAGIQSKLAESERVVREQEGRLRWSVETFVEHYRARVHAAAEAARLFESFDIPDNRRELGDRFASEQAVRLETAKRELQALIVLVKDWRPVIGAVEPMLNGEIDSLEAGILRGDELAILRSIAILERNLESRAQLLKKQLTR